MIKFLENKDLAFKTIICIAVLTTTYATYLALFFSPQALLDFHAFRQTQTALTTYWFIQEGFKLAYETPVAGYPWSIPIEFPLYQFLVAIVAKLSSIPLDILGRLISFFFLLLCLIPIYSITKSLRFPNTVFYIFLALLFSSPLYVYWSRTFMIETTALFLSLMAIKFFIDAIVNHFNLKNVFLFIIFISLAMLQKVTTAAPVLLVLSIAFFALEIKKVQTQKAPYSIFSIKNTAITFFCFCLPLIIAYLWIDFSDNIKMLNNGIGPTLTSTATSAWNWGSVDQRTSFYLYKEVLWNRIFSGNLGGLLGVFVLMLPFISKCRIKVKFIVFFLILLGIISLFLFTNLHIEHTYYQTANVIYLIYALSIVLGGGTFLPNRFFMLCTLVLIVSSNYFSLSNSYLPSIKLNFTKEYRDMAIGEILKRELDSQEQFVAFGNAYSSTFAYLSQRKSFTIPYFFDKFEEAKINPENFVEKGRLGAVVACSSGPWVKKDISYVTALLSWVKKDKNWKVGESHECLIATPQKTFVAKEVKSVQCPGGIDFIGMVRRDKIETITIKGWTSLSNKQNKSSDTVFIRIKKDKETPLYLEALKVFRPEVNRHFGVSNQTDFGYSLVLPALLNSGTYKIDIIQSQKNGFEQCDNLRKNINIK